MSGVDAVNMLRDYIDTAYNGYYGTNRADLFIGQNAAWDADELTALLRCVVANARTLNGTDTVSGLFCRETNNNMRRTDMYRFAGTLFGARGLQSTNDYLYVGNDNKLHDSFIKAQGYEYQCTTEKGRIGLDQISNALVLGTIKHPQHSFASNPWYTMMPAVLPISYSYSDITFPESDYNHYFRTTGGGKNLFVDIIANGYSGEGTSNRAEVINSVRTKWEGNVTIKNRNDAWDRLLEFYNR